jgi:hypothetical protein
MLEIAAKTPAKTAHATSVRVGLCQTSFPVTDTVEPFETCLNTPQGANRTDGLPMSLNTSEQTPGKCTANTRRLGDPRS